MKMKSFLSCQTKFLQITFILLAMLSFASCSSSEKEDDEPLLDGKWSPMEWKQTEGGQPTEHDRYKHFFVVPCSGGTYKFTCLNYNVWMSSVYDNDVRYKANYNIGESGYPEFYYVYGDWFAVESFDNYLSITINENTTGAERLLGVDVWCMDISDYFYFKQKAN